MRSFFIFVETIIVCLINILVLASCNSSSGGGGANPVLLDCTPFAPSSVSLVTWTLNKSGSLFNSQVTINRTNLKQFTSSTTGCGVQKYEMSIVSDYHYIVFSDDPRPIILMNWMTIDDAKDIYDLSSLNFFNNTQVSLCLRAFSTTGEESSWYCNSKSITSNSTPTSTPVPTNTPDSTAPSAPTNLSLSVYWNFSNTVNISYTASSDSESGITRYWSAILDSDFNQITSDKELSMYSTSDSYNVSSLSAGQNYNYALVAENGAGLFSPVAIASFYKPIEVTVYIKYKSMGNEPCGEYPPIYNCQSQVKTMYDTQLLSLKQNKYPTCTLSSLGANTYEIDCRLANSCTVNPIGGYCGGTPTTTYNGSCNPVHGAYVTGSCSGLTSWSPDMPNP